MAGRATKSAITKARSVRQEHGLGLDGPIEDLLALAEDGFGVPVIIPRSLPDDLAGAYLPRADGPVILLNGADSAPRLRFTLAHELGHHAFRDQRREDTHAGIVRPGHWIEVRANAFAAELLIPEPAVLAFVDGAEPPIATVRAVADAFGTSLVMSAIRLVTAGLTDERIETEAEVYESAFADSLSAALGSLPRTPVPNSVLARVSDQVAAAEEEVV